MNFYKRDNDRSCSLLGISTYVNDTSLLSSPFLPSSLLILGPQFLCQGSSLIGRWIPRKHRGKKDLFKDGQSQAPPTQGHAH